jgi:molecular chaperone GrpE
MSEKEKDDSLEQEKKDEKMEIEYVVDKKKSRKTKRDDPEAWKKKLKNTQTEIKKLNKEMEKLKEEYLRQLADKENLRKRLEREKSEFYDYALSELLKEFLVVLDNFERALESQYQENGKSFREGIEMIYKQYRDLLLKQGIIPIEIKEKKFDPQFHQAFMTEESEEVDEPEVAEELQKGYMLHSRLLRPALVKVIVPKKGE